MIDFDRLYFFVVTASDGLFRKFISTIKESRSTLDFVNLRLEGDNVVEPWIQRVIAKVNDLLVLFTRLQLHQRYDHIFFKYGQLFFINIVDEF